jgi:hypothetical protein
MSTWNYRIVKHRWDDHIEDKTTDDYKRLANDSRFPKHDYYSLHEAHYNDGIEICAMTEEACKIDAWETPDELVNSLEMMLKDAKKSKDDTLDYHMKFAFWGDEDELED